mgnify:CR=1 FL=1
MDKESIDIKTAIQIAKIVVTVPEERMPIIWDIFKQAGLDIGGIDEMAEWKALTKQAFLIDTEKFIAGITAGLEPVSGEYRFLCRPAGSGAYKKLRNQSIYGFGFSSGRYRPPLYALKLRTVR